MTLNVTPATTSEISRPDAVTVLAVGPANSVQPLRQLFSRTRWTLLETGSVAQAQDAIREHPGCVVICEARLSDGTWRDLVGHTSRMIVSALHADNSLWMDVLNSGGYNVIGQPFEEQEVFRMVSMAWLHRRDRAKVMGHHAG